MKTERSFRTMRVAIAALLALAGVGTASTAATAVEVDPLFDCVSAIEDPVREGMNPTVPGAVEFSVEFTVNCPLASYTTAGAVITGSAFDVVTSPCVATGSGCTGIAYFSVLNCLPALVEVATAGHGALDENGTGREIWRPSTDNRAFDDGDLFGLCEMLLPLNPPVFLSPLA